MVSNASLRAALAEWCGSKGVALVVPERRFCVDNAAMIAGHAQLRRALGDRGDELSVPAEPVSLLARGTATSRRGDGPKRVQ